MSQHPYEHDAFVMAKLGNLDNKVVLDIGCGRGVTGFLLRIKFGSLKYLVGVDTNLEYLYLAKLHRIYDDIILASAGNLPFRNKSIEGFVTIEVIEHLSIKDGYALLDEIDRIVSNLSLLTTPNGFLKSRTPSNMFEIHRTGWETEELKSKGFQVFGMGLKLYRNFPSGLTYVLQCILTPFIWFIPQISAFLLALKKCNRVES